MAGDIRIPPEELRNKGQDFITKSNEIDGNLKALKSSMEQILGRSDGAFKQKADVVNKQITDNLSKAIQKIREFGEDCKKAADTIDAADKKAAQDTRQS